MITKTIKIIKYALCAQLRPVKQIPFMHRNLSMLPKVLKIDASKQQLQKIIKDSLDRICDDRLLTKKAFSDSQNKISKLYQFIKGEILQQSDKQLNSQFFEKAHYYFQKQGKKVRPIMVEMMATNYINQLSIQPSQCQQFNKRVYLWSALIEMMHIASLAHDDVVDDSPSRRGQQSQHIKYGARPAIFSGNYIISRASKAVAQFNSKRLYQIYANTMSSLAQGEIKQLISKNRYSFSNDQKEKIDSFNMMFERYMQKTYYKSAALMSNSLLGVPTILKQMTSEKQLQNKFKLNFYEIEDKTFQIGQHYGLALQLVDDILDYISTTEEMGKQQMSDLVQGNVTAPVYFTYYHQKNKIPSSGDGLCIDMLNKKKKSKKEALIVKDWVLKGVGIQLTFIMAAKHVQKAFQIMKQLNITGDETLGWRYLGYKLLTRRK